MSEAKLKGKIKKMLLLRRRCHAWGRPRRDVLAVREVQRQRQADEAGEETIESEFPAVFGELSMPGKGALIFCLGRGSVAVVGIAFIGRGDVQC